jgi:hypothetical protein
VKPPTRTPQVEAAPESSGVKESYIQALYVVFWKPIYFVLGIAHGLLFCWLVKQIWGEPVQYAYAIAFLVSAPIAYVELEWFARKLRWDEGPIFDWRDRSTILMAIGFSLAVGLTLFLTINESTSRETARQNAEIAERQKEQLRNQMNSPDFKRGVEFMRQRNAAEQGAIP